jgi:crotonobetainyl-CoA:carnitine CoA-transferase CaiB-like acyl-CoA transferase
MRQVLSDVVVVDVAAEPAGAYCAKTFADLGATVIKVEPPGGDRLRERPGAFLHLNTNKRSVVVDAADPDDRSRLARLLERADLVVQSAGEGDLVAYGLDVAGVRAQWPSLVVTTISGFGADGPYATYRWSDLVAQAAGFATLPQGRSDDVPVKLPAMVALCIVGHTAALGGLAGVLRARASGEGAHVDCAAYEVLGTLPSRAGRYLGWEYLGHQPPPPPATTTSATLLPMGVFPAGDGYVAMMSTPQQLGEMLAVLDNDALRDAFARPDGFVRGDTKEILDAALYPWLLSHTRAELTAAAQAAGWPFAGVNTPAEVLAADHLHQRGFWTDARDPVRGDLVVPGPPYRLAEGGWRLHRGAPALGDADDAAVDAAVAAARAAAVVPPDRADGSAAPLRGIRVLDLTTVWSGPYLTQLLADLGAEVIRVENPSVFPPTTKGYVPRPADPMQLGSLLSMYAPPVEGREDRPYNRHAMNNSIARNTLSATLVPRRPEARELLFRLVEQSDVFIENMKASTLHRLGIHETELLDRNPRLVVMRIPPAGLTGDWAHYTGFGAQFDGLSGLAWITGHHDSELVETPSTTYMDAATGSAGAFAILAALHYREATGRGQLIELAQMENVLAHLGDVYVDLQLGVEPRRLGNRDRWMAPQGVYRCRGQQRWLAVTVSDDAAWAGLARVMAVPELAADPRFATVADRLGRVDELDRMVGDWAAGHDPVEAFHALQAAGVAAAPLLDDDLLAADPNVAARRWIRPLPSTDVGTYPHIGHAFTGLPLAWDRGSPVLGEDNEYVFAKLLGLDDDTRQRLEAAGVIVTDYLDDNGNPV